MRIVFLGTPEWSVQPLQALVAAGHEIVLVVTQPDKKRGRGSALSPSPVKVAAQELFLPVSHRVKDILSTDAELGVVVAFGRLLKPEILDHLTFLNLHPSLLPRWRGATPIESALLAGDQRTGVCVMKLEQEMDAGPIYAKVETPIGDHETSAELGKRLFALGTDLLIEQLSNGIEGLPEPVAQEGEPTLANKLGPDDFHIDWNKSASYLSRLMRIGRTWTTFRDKRFLILEAEVVDNASVGVYSNDPNEVEQPGALHGVLLNTGDGYLRLIQVQPEGKKSQAAQDWARGAQLKPGDHFV